jgi:putative component of membrane protein insertase Oxa1/YidC/SpoIIIJ protein YidD
MGSSRATAIEAGIAFVKHHCRWLQPTDSQLALLALAKLGVIYTLALYNIIIHLCNAYGERRRD